MPIWFFGFTIFTLVNVSHTSTILNLSVTKLSWHVLYYLISKNLYSLQNAQPFIFQLICMQLCKCLNCFLKTHNKQLNQYCLNFIFFNPKKKSFKKWFGSSRVTGQSIFASCKKIWVWVRYFLSQVESENSNPFCHV